MNARVIDCRGKNCGKKIVFLINPETQRSVPVNYESLTMDEVKGLDNGVNVLFNKNHHKSHFLDCPDRERFQKRKKLGSHNNRKI